MIFRVAVVVAFIVSGLAVVGVIDFWVVVLVDSGVVFVVLAVRHGIIPSIWNMNKILIGMTCTENAPKSIKYTNNNY